MMWKVIGALVLVTAALAVSHWAAYRTGKIDGREELRAESAARRSQRRKEARAMPARGRHHLAPFPAADDEPFEKLATTGELRAYAETGDIGSLQRETAAFFRLLSLREWTRKRESAA